MASLLAIENTEAVSMVAACENFYGFENQKDIVRGTKCDIYLNGKKILLVDNIEGTMVRKDRKSRILFGNQRDSERMQVKEYDPKKKDVVIRYRPLERWGGKVTLNSEDFEPLSLKGEYPITVGGGKFGITGSHGIWVKEKLNQKNQEMTFPCRRMTPDGEMTGFNCVNWVKIMSKDEAEKSPLVI